MAYICIRVFLTPSTLSIGHTLFRMKAYFYEEYALIISISNILLQYSCMAVMIIFVSVTTFKIYG